MRLGWGFDNTKKTTNDFSPALLETKMNNSMNDWEVIGQSTSTNIPMAKLTVFFFALGFIIGPGIAGDRYVVVKLPEKALLANLQGMKSM